VTAAACAARPSVVSPTVGVRAERAPFAAGDGPVNAAEIETAEIFEQRLERDESNQRVAL